MTTAIKTGYCAGCGAVGVSCCENSTQRMETATILARLVDRQAREIERLRLLVPEKL